MRAIHPSGLFGRHVGERSRDELGWLGRLALARQTRSDAKAYEPYLAGCGVHQDVARLNIFVDEPLCVEPTERNRQADRDPQKLGHFPRLPYEPSQEFTAGIVEQKRQSSVLASKRTRPHRPGGVEFVPEQILVFEALETL